MGVVRKDSSENLNALAFQAVVRSVIKVEEMAREERNVKVTRRILVRGAQPSASSLTIVPVILVIIIVRKVVDSVGPVGGDIPGQTRGVRLVTNVRMIVTVTGIVSIVDVAAVTLTISASAPRWDRRAFSNGTKVLRLNIALRDAVRDL